MPNNYTSDQLNQMVLQRKNALMNALQNNVQNQLQMPQQPQQQQTGVQYDPNFMQNFIAQNPQYAPQQSKPAVTTQQDTSSQHTLADSLGNAWNTLKGWGEDIGNYVENNWNKGTINDSNVISKASKVKTPQDAAKAWNDLSTNQFGKSIDAGLGDAANTVGNLMQWGGDKMGNLGLQNAGAGLSNFANQNLIQPNQQAATYSKPFGWHSLIDPEWYATTVARQLPSLGLIGAATLGMGDAAAGIGEIAANAAKLGEFGTNVLKAVTGTIGGGTANNALMSAMNASQIYTDALNKGMSHEQADQMANEDFIKNLGLGSVTGLGEAALRYAPIPGLGGMAGNLARLGGSAALQGAQMAGMNMVDNSVTGQPNDWRSIAEQGALGALMGLGMGAAHGLSPHSQVDWSRTETPADVPQDFPDLNTEHANNVLGGKDAADNYNRAMDWVKNDVRTNMSEDLRNQMNDLADHLRNQGFKEPDIQRHIDDAIAKTPEGQRLAQDAVDRLKEKLTPKPNNPEDVIDHQDETAHEQDGKDAQDKANEANNPQPTDDPLYKDVKEFMNNWKGSSVADIQRQFKIPYDRAKSMMDHILSENPDLANTNEEQPTAQPESGQPESGQPEQPQEPPVQPEQPAPQQPEAQAEQPQAGNNTPFQVGDKVKVKGLLHTYEVSDTSDPSKVTVKTPDGKEMTIDRRAVTKLEEEAPAEQPKGQPEQPAPQAQQPEVKQPEQPESGNNTSFQAGDKVKVKGLLKTYEVLDASDPSKLKVKTPDGKEMMIDRRAVTKLEEESSTEQPAPQAEKPQTQPESKQPEQPQAKEESVDQPKAETPAEPKAKTPVSQGSPPAGAEVHHFYSDGTPYEAFRTNGDEPYTVRKIVGRNEDGSYKYEKSLDFTQQKKDTQAKMDELEKAGKKNSPDYKKLENQLASHNKTEEGHADTVFARATDENAQKWRNEHNRTKEGRSTAEERDRMIERFNKYKESSSPVRNQEYIKEIQDYIQEKGLDTPVRFQQDVEKNKQQMAGAKKDFKMPWEMSKDEFMKNEDWKAVNANHKEQKTAHFMLQPDKDHYGAGWAANGSTEKKAKENFHYDQTQWQIRSDVDSVSPKAVETYTGPKTEADKKKNKGETKQNLKADYENVKEAKKNVSVDTKNHTFTVNGKTFKISEFPEHNHEQWGFAGKLLTDEFRKRPTGFYNIEETLASAINQKLKDAYPYKKDDHVQFQDEKGNWHEGVVDRNGPHYIVEAIDKTGRRFGGPQNRYMVTPDEMKPMDGKAPEKAEPPKAETPADDIEKRIEEVNQRMKEQASKMTEQEIIDHAVQDWANRQEIKTHLENGDMKKARTAFERNIREHGHAGNVVDYSYSAGKPKIETADGRTFEPTMTQLFNRYVELWRKGQSETPEPKEEPKAETPAPKEETREPFKKGEIIQFHSNTHNKELSGSVLYDYPNRRAMDLRYHNATDKDGNFVAGTEHISYNQIVGPKPVEVQHDNWNKEKEADKAEGDQIHRNQSEKANAERERLNKLQAFKEQLRPVIQQQHYKTGAEFLKGTENTLKDLHDEFGINTMQELNEMVSQLNNPYQEGDKIKWDGAIWTVKKVTTDNLLQVERKVAAGTESRGVYLDRDKVEPAEKEESTKEEPKTAPSESKQEGKNATLELTNSQVRLTFGKDVILPEPVKQTLDEYKFKLAEKNGYYYHNRTHEREQIAKVIHDLINYRIPEESLKNIIEVGRKYANDKYGELEIVPQRVIFKNETGSAMNLIQGVVNSAKEIEYQPFGMTELKSGKRGISYEPTKAIIVFDQFHGHSADELEKMITEALTFKKVEEPAKPELKAETPSPKEEPKPEPKAETPSNNPYLVGDEVKYQGSNYDVKKILSDKEVEIAGDDGAKTVNVHEIEPWHQQWMTGENRNGTHEEWISSLKRGMAVWNKADEKMGTLQKDRKADDTEVVVKLNGSNAREMWPNEDIVPYDRQDRTAPKAETPAPKEETPSGNSHELEVNGKTYTYPVSRTLPNDRKLDYQVISDKNGEGWKISLGKSASARVYRLKENPELVDSLNPNSVHAFFPTGWKMDTLITADEFEKLLNGKPFQVMFQDEETADRILEQMKERIAGRANEAPKEEPKPEPPAPKEEPKQGKPPLDVIDESKPLPKVAYKETKSQISATFKPVQWDSQYPSIFKGGNDVKEPETRTLVFPKGKDRNGYNDYMRLPNGVSTGDIHTLMNIDFPAEGVRAKELTDMFDYMNGKTKEESPEDFLNNHVEVVHVGDAPKLQNEGKEVVPGVKVGDTIYYQHFGQYKPIKVLNVFDASTRTVPQVLVQDYTDPNLKGTKQMTLQEFQSRINSGLIRLEEPKAETPVQDENKPTLSFNEEKNGVELKFPGKPSEDVRERMKLAKFRWSKPQGLWFAKRTPETEKLARELAGENTPAEEPKQEENAAPPENTNVETPAPKENSFYTYKNGIGFTEVKGTEVSKVLSLRAGFDVQAFMYKNANDGKWHVVEKQSGASMGNGETKEAALDKTIDNLKKYGEEKINEIIQKNIEKTGRVPGEANQETPAPQEEPKAEEPQAEPPAPKEEPKAETYLDAHSEPQNYEQYVDKYAAQLANKIQFANYLKANPNETVNNLHSIFEKDIRDFITKDLLSEMEKKSFSNEIGKVYDRLMGAVGTRQILNVARMKVEEGETNVPANELGQPAQENVDGELSGPGSETPTTGATGENPVQPSGNGKGNGSSTGGPRLGGSSGSGNRGPRDADATRRDGGTRTPVTENPNYHLSKEDITGIKGKKTTAQNNIDIIKLAKQIDGEGRPATLEEKKKLVQYVGWGALKNALDPDWQVKPEWKPVQQELKQLLTKEEFASAQASRMNAHYTDVDVIDAMYQGLQHLGFDGGKLLEPSAGIGHFIGMLPDSLLSKSRFTAIELDPVTALIGRLLYPRSDFRNMGFEKAKTINNFYDVAIGNVPFQEVGVYDKDYPKGLTDSLHNYFLVKSIDKVRPGGIMMMITSGYTMDAKDSTYRKYIADRAELLGAIRLPNNAFEGNAGTNVTTDILILKKLPEGQKGNTDWVKTDKMEMPVPENQRTSLSGNSQVLDINPYFIHNPKMVLGDLVASKNMYGSFKPEVFPNGKDLKKEIIKAMQKLPAGSFEKNEVKVLSPEEINQMTIPAPSEVKEGAYHFENGRMYQKLDGNLVPLNMKGAEIERVKGLISVRNSMRELFQAEANRMREEGTEKQVEDARKNLNKTYDAFVKKNGPINYAPNVKAFADDPDFYLLSSIENYDKETKKATKGDIFTKSTSSHYVPVTKADNPHDGMLISLNERGSIDLPRIQELTGMSEEAIVKELEPYIFKDPSQENYVTREEYLSGNVREKLQYAEAAARLDDTYKRNVEELSKVIPKDIPAEEISTPLGAGWIPEDTMKQFVGQHLMEFSPGAHSYRALTVGYNPTLAEWTVSIGGEPSQLNRDNGFTANWGHSSKQNTAFLEAAINNKDMKVQYKVEVDGREVTVTDKKATLALQERLKRVRDEFTKWIWQDEKRKADLARLYNDKYNSLVLRQYDGSHLTLPNMNPEIAKQFRPYQKNAVYRITQGGNALLAHAVGAGKTWEMIAGMMELKRLGQIQKPIWTVPNHLVEQMARDFQLVYPTANILVAGKKDFEAKNRKKLIAKIATRNYDVVIMPHTSFGKISMSPENQERFLREQIDQLEKAIEMEVLNGERSDKRLTKTLENAKKNLEKKMAKALDKIKKDADTAHFEDLGVDGIVVDEAHEFKNLMYATRRSNVGGLGNSEGSGKAFDLYMKVRYLNELNGGKGVVFATGTPISNSLAEMYHMQRYLQHNTLQAMGIENFDAWANNFADIKRVLEMAPEGNGYRQKEKVAGIINAPELLTLFRTFADVKTTEELLASKLITHPVTNRHTVEVEASPELEQYIQELVDRAALVRAKQVQPEEDNMLKITNDGRKAALDMRMIYPNMKEPGDNKINSVAGEVAKVWKDTKADKGTQLVFLDLGTPGKETEDVDAPFDAYNALKNKLIRKGIPENEIAFIHDANTDDKKAVLFDKVNAGEVRVLVGSSQKMGAGMNVQKRLKALHHVDVPWRPSDIEQREGRILRHGNTNKDVDIYTYVQKKSFDAYMWQLQESKAKIINRVMSGDLTSRTIEDDSDLVMNASKMKSIAADDPRIFAYEQAKMDAERLTNAREDYLRRKASAQVQLDTFLPRNIQHAEEKIAGLEKDMAKVTDTSGDKFKMKVAGTEYTSRTDAGKFLYHEIERVKGKAGKPGGVQVGEISGFPVKYAIANKDEDGVEKSIENLWLEGHDGNEYTVSLGTESGTITSMESRLKNIKPNLDFYKEELEKAEKQKSQLEKVVTLPFENEAELQQAIEKRDKLQKELAIDENAQDDIVDDGEGNITGKNINKELADRINARNGDNLGIAAPSLFRPRQGTRSRKYGFEDPTIQSRVDAAESGPQISTYQKVKHYLQQSLNRLTREFEHLPHTAEFSPLRHELLRLQKQRAFALEQTARNLHAIVIDLNRDQYHLFRNVVLAEDLMEEMRQGHDLAFGFTPEKLRAEYSRLKGFLAQEKPVRDALTLRTRLWNQLKSDYIRHFKDIGVNMENRFTKKNYFRHSIIQYMQADRAQHIMGNGKLKTPKGKGYMKQREGSELDYITDYLHAEAEVMANMMFDMEVAKSIKLVDDKYNIEPALRTQANEENAKSYAGLIQKESDEIQRRLELEKRGLSDDEINEQLKQENALLPDRVRQVLETYKADYNLKPVKKYATEIEGVAGAMKARVGWAYSELQKAAEEDADVWTGEHGEYQSLVDALANGDNLPKEEWFQYLADLAASTDKLASKAQTYLKYNNLQKTFQKDIVGDGWKNVMDMIPAGYDLWRPDDSNVFHMANTVPDWIAERLFAGMLDDITEKTFSKQLVLDGKRKGFIVKDEVKETLDNLMKPDKNRMSFLAKLGMQKLKKIYFNSPATTIKYNIRNTVGELEHVIAADPKTFLYAPQASKELYDVMFKNAAPSLNMRKFLEYGGIHTVVETQEFGDLRNLNMFQKQMAEKDMNALAKAVRIPANVWNGIWKLTNKGTIHRESILRYASFLSYLNQIEKNGGKPKNYGSSIPEEIDALDSKYNKAFQLSNDLLIAYDKTSHTGQWLRSSLIPFWSFTEGNARSFIQLAKNAMRDDDLANVVGRKLVAKALLKSPLMVLRAGKLAIALGLISALATLWNNLMFPQEEKDLPEIQRDTLHLILGKDGNGQTAYYYRLGALQDFLEWFGADTFTKDIQDLLDGKRSFWEIAKTDALKPVNKLVGSISPYYQQALEQISGEKFYPNFLKPSPLTDRLNEFFSMMQLNKEYTAVHDMLLHKPSKPYRVSNWVTYTTDPEQDNYYTIRDNADAAAAKFLGKATGQTMVGARSQKSNILADLKLGLHYDDKSYAEEKYQEYLKAGGTASTLKSSLKQLDPLNSIPVKDRQDYYNSLSPEDQQNVQRAEQFYQKVLLDGINLNNLK